MGIPNRITGRLTAALATVVVCGLLSACGPFESVASPVAGTSASAPASGTASASGSAAPGASTSGGASTPAPGGSSPGSGVGSPGPDEVVVSGSVRAGVELGCLLLESPDTEYLLVGGERTRMVVGSEITVRGRVERDLMTTCQQGTPLRVFAIQTG